MLVPGFVLNRTRLPVALISWLRQAAQAGARICAVCTGAFALAEAGLLHERACTTHWKRTAELQRRFPSARVANDRLFVEDGNILTSAGVASGIDMALAHVEEDYGSRMAADVARELVVYMRRDATQSQNSVYLAYRNHMNSAVHAVQDALLAHPEAQSRLSDFARIAGTSVRNLSRIFRQTTGITITAYRQRVRLEEARMLLANPELNLEEIAELCGFNDARQLRRLWRLHFDGALHLTRRLNGRQSSSQHESCKSQLAMER